MNTPHPTPTDASERAWLLANPEPPEPPDEGATGAQIRARILWLMARNEAVLRGEVRPGPGCGLGDVDDPQS